MYMYDGLQLLLCIYKQGDPKQAHVTHQKHGFWQSLIFYI